MDMKVRIPNLLENPFPWTRLSEALEDTLFKLETLVLIGSLPGSRVFCPRTRHEPLHVRRGTPESDINACMHDCRIQALLASGGRA